MLMVDIKMAKEIMAKELMMQEESIWREENIMAGGKYNGR